MEIGKNITMKSTYDSVESVMAAIKTHVKNSSEIMLVFITLGKLIINPLKN